MCEDVVHRPFHGRADTCSPLRQGGGIDLLGLLPCLVLFWHVFFLRGVSVRHHAAFMPCHTLCTGIHLHVLHVPEHLHHLAYILEGDAVHVTLSANADVVSACQFHLLAVAETVHSVRKRLHLRLLVLLEDLPSGTALIRQRAVLVKKLEDTPVDGIQRIPRLALYTWVDILVELVYCALGRTLVARLPHTAGRRLDAVVSAP